MLIFETNGTGFDFLSSNQQLKVAHTVPFVPNISVGTSAE